MERFVRDNFGAMASPYLTAYLYKRRFIDTQYSIRKDGDTFKISDSALTVDSESDITVRGRISKGRGACGTF